MFSIKACRVSYEVAVGHLPREVSRPTKFLLDLGEVIKATLSSTRYRRSSLFQGGPEIICFITVAILETIRKRTLLDYYKTLVNALYDKPKNEVVIETFLTPTMQSSGQQQYPKRGVKMVAVPKAGVS